MYLFDSELRRIWFCRLQNQLWIEKSYNKEIEADVLCQAVIWNGKLYALTLKTSELVSIDMIVDIDNTDSLAIRLLENELPSPRQQLSLFLRKDLVKSCGELFVIITTFTRKVCGHVIGIKIFKLDFSSMVWKRVENAKD